LRIMRNFEHKTCFLYFLSYTICMVWENHNLLVKKTERTSLSQTIALFFLCSNTRPVDIKSSPVGGKSTNESWYTVLTQTLMTRGALPRMRCAESANSI